jgi:hypothetical protein
MTLTEFLEARIEEDERRAGGGWARLGDSRWETDNYGRDFLTPSAVLAECAAKRLILDRHHPDGHLENWYWLERKCEECGRQWHKWEPNKLPTDIGPEVGCPTLQALATIYANHPDYRQEWPV